MHKAFIAGDVKALDTGNPNGEFEVILSAETVDRDGEIIDAKAFEPLPEMDTQSGYIAHIPAALTAVMRANATLPDFPAEGNLALKPWFGSDEGLNLPGELRLPVVEAPAGLRQRWNGPRAAAPALVKRMIAAGKLMNAIPAKT